MAGGQICSVCGKPKDPKERGNFHIKHKTTKTEKHAHHACVMREPAKAKAQGF